MKRIIPPRTFLDAVLRVMKDEGLAVKPAIARARAIFSDLYEGDRALTRNFTESAWFDLVTEARCMVASENIPLGEAMARVYQENPAIAKQLLGRHHL